MIFIDFDDTIFNTKSFKREYLKIFEGHGISKEVFEQTYYAKNSNTEGLIYDHEQHLEKIGSMTNVEMAQVKDDVRQFLKDTSRFVFADFGSFSKIFKKKQLILVSYGFQPFQGIKIRSSGVAKSFNRVVVTSGKKSLIIQNILARNSFNEKTFFIDDRPDQLADVMNSIGNVVPIRVRRRWGRFRDLESKQEGIVEVKTLKSAAKIIKAHQD